MIRTGYTLANYFLYSKKFVNVEKANEWEILIIGMVTIQTMSSRWQNGRRVVT